MTIEALAPCCSKCKLKRPEPCAYRDWITEHAYPCVYAIRSMEIEVASRETTWDGDALRRLAGRRLSRETGNEDGIKRVMEDNTLEHWVILQGIDEAINVFGGRYSAFGSDLFHGLYEKADKSRWRVLSVCLPLPEKKFTVLPLLFDYVTYSKDDKWQFLRERFDQDQLCFGDSDEWTEGWREWWRDNGVSQKQWERHFKGYVYRKSDGGKPPLEDAAELLSKVQERMVDLVNEEFNKWEIARGNEG